MVDKDSPSSQTTAPSSEDYESVEAAHPPLSPATPAESFFLPQLGQSDISATYLASEIQRNNKRGPSSNRSNYSVATDDFASACENSVDLDSPEYTQQNNLFGKDVLIISRHQSIPEDPEDDSLDYEDTMTDSTTTPNHADIAQHVYEGAKGAWAWGKSKAVFKPFLGLAEGIASKVVGVAGTNLGQIDSQIKPKLSGLDDAYLNPAINAVAGMVITAVSKGEAFVKPIIMTVLGPVGLAQIEDGSASDSKKKQKPEAANPEMTTPVAVMN